MQYMSIEQFQEEGYLQEVNRLYFHIMGLALEVRMFDEMDPLKDPELRV